MALDEKRIDARKSINCPCIAPKPDDWKPNRLNDIRIGKYIYGEILLKLVFNTSVKALLQIHATLTSTTLFGTRNMFRNLMASIACIPGMY